MRVLIVGCGYVGLAMGAELVRAGHTVFGLRRTAAPELPSFGIQPLAADISNPQSLAELGSHQFDFVANTVASGGGNEEDYRRTYLEGTKNLLRWLAPTPPRAFVYTSSTAVYAQNDGSTATEESPAQPESGTSAVLIETERVLLDAARDENFPAMILRCAGIYGPHRGYWLKQFLAGEARMEGGGERWLNMIHRDDVIGAAIAALENGKAGEIYNVVDDEPVQQRAVFEWLAARLEKPLPPSAPESNAPRRRGVTNKRVSNRKLKLATGWQLKYPSFREGYSAELARLGL
jgi:nucleoside-diphosphate-sugar epimerase